MCQWRPQVYHLCLNFSKLISCMKGYNSEVASAKSWCFEKSLEYPFLAGKWSLIPNVATIIRALVTAKNHQTAASFGCTRPRQRQVGKDFRVCQCLPHSFMTADFQKWVKPKHEIASKLLLKREQKTCRCWLGLGMLMNVVLLRCFGDWQRLEARHPASSRAEVGGDHREAWQHWHKFKNQTN